MTSRLEQVLALAAENPAEPMPHYMAGNELLNAGEYEQAIEHLQRYVDLLPGGDVGAAYRMLGRSYAGLGDSLRAREACAAGARAARAHGHGDLAAAIEKDAAGL
jgi:predicted Zn-dependent protease